MLALAQALLQQSDSHMVLQRQLHQAQVQRDAVEQRASQVRDRSLWLESTLQLDATKKHIMKPQLSKPSIFGARAVRYGMNFESLAVLTS